MRKISSLEQALGGIFPDGVGRRRLIVGLVGCLKLNGGKLGYFVPVS